jgi:uncharacterized SAM-binding protein YcdF (DUF218 family)
MTIAPSAIPARENPAAAGPPGRKRRPWRFLRWIEHVLASAVALLLLILVSPLPRWLHGQFDCQGPLEPAKYIICLGGDPSRVLEGTRLFLEGYGEKLIVSNNEAGAPMMRALAIDWGAPPDLILVDSHSRRTADHPVSIQGQCGVDPLHDACIVVTSYLHLARSKACFEKAGYRSVIMREPRWERQFRTLGGWRNRYHFMPALIYECGALVEYWVRGWI